MSNVRTPLAYESRISRSRYPRLAQSTAAHLEQRDLEAGLAQLALGKDRRLGRSVLRRTPWVIDEGRRRGERSGLKECAAVRFMVGHRLELLVRCLTERSFPWRSVERARCH